MPFASATLPRATGCAAESIKSYSSYFSPSIGTHLQIISAREAKNRFGQLLDSAQRGPVSVTKNGRVVTVMLSIEQYQRLRGAAWDRLARAMDTLSEEATSKGLMDGTLEALLAAES